MAGQSDQLREWVVQLDEAFLVVNKPAGILTLPDGYDPQIPHLGSLLEPLYGRLWIVHRLDKETSGVIALARNAQAHRALNMQFQERNVSKVYHALVVGVPGWETLVVRSPLRANVGRRHRTVVDRQRGKPAQTEFRVLARYQTHSLVEAIPFTGRPHQIRAHLAARGFPILADPLYGPAQSPPDLGLTRLGLHAWSLCLAHPLSGERLTFKAHYPSDFSGAIEAAGRGP